MLGESPTLYPLGVVPADAASVARVVNDQQIRADLIVVMERGKVLHCAPHEVLLKECATYARLWQQQTRHL